MDFPRLFALPIIDASRVSVDCLDYIDAFVCHLYPDFMRPAIVHGACYGFGGL